MQTVDPQSIQLVSGNGRPVFHGEIKGGDWDRDCNFFVERVVPESIRLHYEEGVPWEDTPLRTSFHKKVEQGSAWGHQFKSDFDARTKEIESLVENIDENGYQSKRDLQKTGVSISSNEPIPPIFDEVTVDIGRDGDLLWRDFGQHRLAAAQILDISEIPVIVATRHEQYINGNH